MALPTEPPLPSGLSPLALLARELHWKQTMLDPELPNISWDELTPQERMIYSASVSWLIAHRDLVRAALEGKPRNDDVFRAGDGGKQPHSDNKTRPRGNE